MTLAPTRWLTLLAASSLACQPGNLDCDSAGDRCIRGWVDTAVPARRAGADHVDADRDGFAPIDGDCDDADPRAHPQAAERCDGVDNDCDGAIDEGLGRALVQETDVGADGIVDAVTYATYDIAGRLVLSERDTDADGVIDTALRFEHGFDRRGRLQVLRTDEGADGVFDTLKFHVYDAHGGWLLGYETDEGADGTIDRIDTFVYDSATGRRIAWEWDLDGDGSPETVYRYSHDARSGRLTQMRIERAGVGRRAGVVTRYAYDYLPNGKIAFTHVDLTDDGRFERTLANAYHPETGRILRVLTDDDHDGRYDSEIWYGYDGTGVLLATETDADLDGHVDTRIDRFELCVDRP